MEFKEFQIQFTQLKDSVKAVQELDFAGSKKLMEIVSTKIEALEKIDFAGLKEKNEGYETRMVALESDLKKAQEKVLKMSEQMVAKVGLSDISTRIKAEITGDNYKKWMGGNMKGEPFQIKMAAGDMAHGSNIDDYSAIPFLGVPVRTPVKDVVVAQPMLLELITSVPLNGTNAVIEQYLANDDGSPAYIAEATAKPKVDFDIKQKTFQTEEISAHVVVSDKMLRVVTYMMTQINIVLVRRIKVVMDLALYNGDGVSPNIAGLTTLGSAFDGTKTGLKGKLGTIVAEDRNEIMTAVRTQMVKQSFAPKYWLLNPTDVALLELQKDTNDRPLLTNFADTLMQAFKRIPILENNNVPEGEFALIDNTWLLNYVLSDLVIEVGYYNDLWVKNQTAVKAFAEHVLVLNPNYSQAVIYGDFASAVGELNA